MHFQEYKVYLALAQRVSFFSVIQQVLFMAYINFHQEAEFSDVSLVIGIT